MKTKRIKATLFKAVLNEAGGDGVEALRHEWTLPADAESYERMVEQVKCSVWPHKNLADDVHEAFRKVARDALKSIGITPPKKGTKCQH